MSKPGVAVWDASLLTTLIVRSIITTMRLQTIEAGRQGTGRQSCPPCVIRPDTHLDVVIGEELTVLSLLYAFDVLACAL